MQRSTQVLLLVLALAVAGCFGASNAAATGASIAADGLDLTIEYGGCRSDAPVFVVEEDVRVLVRVEQEVQPCDAIQVTTVVLDEPLGVREVVDLTSGRRLDVTRPG